jgi:hypothetical protein
MNRKQFISPVIVAVLVLLGVSCKKDFLDKNPPNTVSTAIFWTTEADVQSAVAGVYTRLQENFLGYERVYLDGFTDNAYLIANPFHSGLTTIAFGGISPVTATVSEMYSTPYRVIASANYFLANVGKAPITDVKRDVYSAEVRFLRALAYFDLAQTFGDVVIYTTPPETLESSQIPKSSRAEVYALIEEDLNFAMSKLPDEKYNGHAVKGSAAGILARVLMTQQKYTEAVPVLQQIISSGKFGLSNSYAALFRTAGQSNAAVNTEIMFSTQYLAPVKIHRNLNGMDLELGSYSIMQPYKNLVDEYEMTDGKLITESPLYNPAAPYANRDPRLDLTVKLPGEKWLAPNGTEYVPSINNPASGFIMEKYVDLSRAPITPATANSTDQDYIHLRYADVLLMYAEAKNEVSGPDATVYKAINDVRGRTGINMPAVDQARYNTKETLRDYIRHERRIELALEGQRYNDLKRWNVAHIILPKIKDPNGVSMIFDQRNYFWPFPQTEIDANTRLDQNENYL